MATKIKFGTDGWRAVIAETYTTDNVARVAYATATWMKKNFQNPSIVIGHDCRFGGDLFVETAIRVYLHEGLKVYHNEGITSTPMLSLGTKNYGCNLGIIVTASHNPPTYNGYKIKAAFGGPLEPEYVQEIEDLIPEACPFDYKEVNQDEFRESNQLSIVKLEDDYIHHVEKNFDLEAIRNSGLHFVYDAMYGAGQDVMRRLFPTIDFLHCDYNPSFKGVAPEPIERNLQELENFIKKDGTVDVALITDGDADRIGLYDGKGVFIDSHHIILLLIHYLAKYKAMKGKVVTAVSCTPRVNKMAEHYGFSHDTTKIGFKYIASIMTKEDVLLGGEESGGIAVKGHLPERDGIWMGLIIWEFMAKSGKSLDQLIEEVYELVGEFKFERNDLHINEELKQEIVKNCKENKYTSFGKYQVKNVQTIDGFKFFLDDERWVMIRPSGTEPVLRTYAEAPTIEEVREILKITKETICK